MDTSPQISVVPKDKEASVVRQRRSIAEKRRIVEEYADAWCIGGACGTGAWSERQPVVWLAQAVLGGRLGEAKPRVKLLPVRGSGSLPTPVAVERAVDIPKPQSGTIHLELRYAQIRIEGNADPALVRVVLEYLRA